MQLSCLEDVSFHRGCSKLVVGVCRLLLPLIRTELLADGNYKVADALV